MGYKFTYSEENRIRDIAMKLIKTAKTNAKLKFTDKELLMIRKMAMLHQTDNNLLIDTWMKVNPNMTEEESKYTLNLMLSNTKWNYFDTSNKVILNSGSLNNNSLLWKEKMR